MLGECGATVYVTGRSRAGRRAQAAGEDLSLVETARLVSDGGGTGIAVEVDHSVDAEVEVLFTKVRHEQGKLDILVDTPGAGTASMTARLYMAKDLAWNDHDVAVVGLSPGLMRTEAILEEVGTEADNWHTKPILDGSESTELTGRGVAALATDNNVLAKSGQTFQTRQLARDYGYSDVDGRMLMP